jgi:choline monooxygenase
VPLSEYVFEPRLSRASTPPADWYTNPEQLEREEALVFRKSWQLTGTTHLVDRPGRYFTTECAGEPMIVVNDASRVKALSNVCRHRAGPVACGSGERKSFQCRYHGWSYGLDGRLLAAREFGGVECFQTSDVRLPELRTEVVGPLIFTDVSGETAPLAEVLEDIPGEITRRAAWEKMAPAHRKTWDVSCNWKVYVDNYLEGYHIPLVHPSLNRSIDYDAYTTIERKWSSQQCSPIRDEPSLPLGSGDAFYAWIYPNLMINVYPDNFSTNLIIPVGPEKTTMIFEWFFLPEARHRMEEVVRISDEIQLEDISICEAVQKGLRSKTYHQGRYSVARENAVHHFHGLLASALSR